MAIDSRVINATVEIETIEAIMEMAKQEKRRSFSNMVAVLLEEAVKARRETNILQTRVSKKAS